MHQNPVKLSDLFIAPPPDTPARKDNPPLNPTSLIPFACIVVFASVLVWDAIRLSKYKNWLDRVTKTHATVYSRLAEYGFWAIRHLIAALTDGQDRRLRLRKAAFSAGVFGLVILPILIAAQVASGSEVAEHAVAFAIGTAIWSIVVETPNLPYRVQDRVPATRLVPLAAGAAIVAFLDLAIGVLALAGAASGATHAFATGAAFVAAGDLVSGLVGLTIAAAASYPLGDPPRPKRLARTAHKTSSDAKSSMGKRLTQRLPQFKCRKRSNTPESDQNGRVTTLRRRSRTRKGRTD